MVGAAGWFAAGMCLWIGGALGWQRWQGVRESQAAAAAIPRKTVAVKPPVVVSPVALVTPAAPQPAIDWPAQHIADADAILAKYRTSSDPVLHDFDWHKAEIRLQDAADSGRAEEETLGKLALVKGYDVLERLSVGDFTPDRVAQLRKQAYADFDEAATRMPASADPHLALARIFVYSLPDLDKALAQFHQAETRGANLGPREIEEQADAYRIRAQQLAPRAPREAWQAAQMARSLYRKVGNFDRAQQHLQELAPIHPPAKRTARRRSRWP
jgi:tetratricopeptide (TPR) repeat protein